MLIVRFLRFCDTRHLVTQCCLFFVNCSICRLNTQAHRGRLEFGGQPLLSRGLMAGLSQIDLKAVPSPGESWSLMFVFFRDFQGSDFGDLVVPR